VYAVLYLLSVYQLPLIRLYEIDLLRGRRPPRVWPYHFWLDLVDIFVIITSVSCYVTCGHSFSRCFFCLFPICLCVCHFK